MLPIFLKQLFWAIPSLFWRKTDRNAARFEQKCDHSVYAATSVSKTGEMLPVFLNCFCSIFASLATVEKLIIFPTNQPLHLYHLLFWTGGNAALFFQDLFLTVRSLPLCAGGCCPFVTEKCDHSTALFVSKTGGNAARFRQSTFGIQRRGNAALFSPRPFLHEVEFSILGLTFEEVGVLPNYPKKNFWALYCFTCLGLRKLEMLPIYP